MAILRQLNLKIRDKETNEDIKFLLANTPGGANLTKIFTQAIKVEAKRLRKATS